jgi:hypothetical protein
MKLTERDRALLRAAIQNEIAQHRQREKYEYAHDVLRSAEPEVQE